jgi:hypothetical protein
VTANRAAWAAQGVVLALLPLLWAAPAAAQQEADTLPAVNYPFPVPGTAPNAGPPVAVSRPAQLTDDTPPLYVMVGGVWGYWDRTQHFHRAPAFVEGRRLPELRRPPLAVVRLPNAQPRRIVTGVAMARGRGPVR